VASY